MFGTPRGGRKPGDRRLGLPREALQEGRQARLRRRRAASVRAQVREACSPDRAPARRDEATPATPTPTSGSPRSAGPRAGPPNPLNRGLAGPGRPAHRGVQVLQEEAQASSTSATSTGTRGATTQRRRRPLRVVPELGPARRRLRREAVASTHSLSSPEAAEEPSRTPSLGQPARKPCGGSRRGAASPWRSRSSDRARRLALGGRPPPCRAPSTASVSQTPLDDRRTSTRMGQRQGRHAAPC